MPTPPTTSNHELPLVPPLGDANASDFEDIWGSILNDDGWSRLDEKLIVRDTLANSGNYTPYNGALYWATDSGKPVLEGDGSSWTTISVEFADVVASFIDVDDVTAGTVTVETAPADPTDAIRKQELDALDADKLEVSNYNPISDVDGEISAAATSVSGLDSAVSSNDSDISSLQSNKFDAVNYTPVADIDGEISAAASTISGLDTTVSNNDSDISSLQSNKFDAVNYTPETDTHSRYADSEAISAVESSSGLALAAGLDLSGDLSDGTTTIWDSSAGSILSTALEADSVSVAGRSVSLGGSTNIAHGDLTSISENQHHSKNHDHSEGDISTVPNAGLSNSSVTLAGNTVSLGSSSAIAHGDLSSIGTNDHHSRDHDHSEQGISTVGNQGLTNYQVTVAGNTIALGASKAIDHADLSSVGANDHHIAHEHPGDRAASSAIDVGGNDVTQVANIKGQYADVSFGGSTFNIDLQDANADGRYRNIDNDTIIWFRNDGSVEVPNGQLSEYGNRVATRTWANSTFENFGAFTWSEDASGDLVLTDGNVELIRQPKAGATQFLQGADIGSIEAPEDSYTQVINSSVTSAASSGDTVGYTFAVDNKTLMSVSGDADGSGGTSSESVDIETGATVLNDLTVGGTVVEDSSL